jgi:hypothetical protein
MWKVLLCLLWAQNPPELFQKAPPDIDEALRARISKFYQLHVEGKFRQAEALVAEDTKDLFYDSHKPKYLSFEIVRIEYSENFTKAKATMLVETFVPIAGFADKPIKMPIPSYWKVVDGQWYWWVDPEIAAMTPFGKMKLPAPGATPPAQLPAKMVDLQSIMNQVKADKNMVNLNPKLSSSEQVTIVNQMPGSINLVLEAPKVPGVEMKIDRTELKAGEKAIVTLRSEPVAGRPRNPFVLRVTVQPTNQVIPIQVAFSAQP